MTATLHESCRNGRLSMWRPKATSAAVAMISVGSQLAAPPVAMADSPAPPIVETQATLKRLGFGITSITLPAKAARRLDIQTAEIRDDPSGGRVTPYSSVIYDLDGDAWVYRMSAPLTFVREAIVVERIKGDFAYLKDGPPSGTQVVTVGVPELYGTEVGVNGE